MLPYDYTVVQQNTEPNNLWKQAKLVLPINGRVMFQNYNKASQKDHVCYFGNTTNKESTFDISDLVSSGLDIKNGNENEIPKFVPDAYKADKKVINDGRDSAPNQIFTTNPVTCFDFVRTKT